jgi:predicted regulator of Ras-like GTPase activity (Roadblock/LC7/MglB family)
MSADAIVQSLMSNVPKAIAAGVVDMDSGMLLAIKTVDSHPQAVLDMVAAATKDLYEGDTVMNIENTFKKARGDSYSGHYFREIIVTSKNLLHIFARLDGQENVVAVVVARIDTNLGLALMKTREVASQAKV